MTKLALSLLSLAGLSYAALANTVVAPIFLSQADAVAPHLKPVSRVVLTFSFTVPKGFSKFSLLHAIAPETGTQLNPTTAVEVYPLNSKVAVESDRLTRKEVDLHTSDGKQKAEVVWFEKVGDADFDEGANVKINYAVDLYSYTEPPKSTGPFADVKAKSSTRYADATSPKFLDWMAGQGLDPLRRSSNVLEDVSKVIYTVGGIIYSHEQSVKKASEGCRTGGDCGSKSVVCQAGLLAYGIPMRIVTGWLIRPSGLPERHCRVEFLPNGHWTPAEPTGYRRNMNPSQYIGIDGTLVENFTTLHFGLGISASAKDASREEMNVSENNLQYPVLEYTLEPTRVRASTRIRANSPAVKLSRS